MTTTQLKQAIRQGKYSWPGAYPTFFVTSDGACLCHDCVKSEFRRSLYQVISCLESTKYNYSDGWKIEGHDANWEDPALYCDHCNARIESAYAEEEAV